MAKNSARTSRDSKLDEIDKINEEVESEFFNEEEVESKLFSEEEIESDSSLQMQANGSDLEDLTGVGPTIAEKLREGGFNTYESISVASPKEISAATSIGEATAQKIILSARSKLNIGFSTAEKILIERKNVKRITTGSEKLDGLLGQGLETRAITEVFGEFRTGKTQIAHQLCVTVQLSLDKGGLDGAALYIDSEGTFRPERLLQIATRFGLKDEKVLKNVHYARAYNSDHQILIIETAAKLIQEKNIKLIIVDSVMSHFRAEYIGRGTLNERQQKLNKFVHKLLQIAEAYNIA
ncbi:MAG: DNA repair and recombination protein RadA, partial [Promethearchaeota archaeon]